MAKRIGFDNEKYLTEQSEEILKRVKRFNNKLYLEFGGKILFDYHAARVLPGFDPNVKMRLLQKLKDDAEIILAIYAGDIEKKKMRADFGITYDADALRTIDDYREWGLTVRAVVITRFENQPAAVAFKNKLERRGMTVYTHRFTKGYPTDVDTIVSAEGYGANPYIETQKPIIVVTGPGPGSGKLATCLSQLYHEHLRGVNAGYAKFETFPIWNLPLKHMVNVAYESATCELRDVNVIDHFHLEAHKEYSVNYNRDVEAFPLLKRIIEKITGQPSHYQSPTDMGVNRAGFGIVDDAAVTEASRQEIVRRYYRYSCEYALGLVNRETVERAEVIMKDVGASPAARVVVAPAMQAAEEAKTRNKGNDGIYCGAALELKDGAIITGNNSPLMHAASALILNAVKHLARIPKEIDLLPATITGSIGHLKKDICNGRSPSLDLEETLICLSISATFNPSASVALEKLKELRGCEVHLTHMPSPGDEAGLRKLGVNVTSNPEFASKYLFSS
ncbi:MAG TPA: DUF1846 domain-containing protein [bacterium]|nr:DUF1846 domain-containing protein [bacterium]